MEEVVGYPDLERYEWVVIHARGVRHTGIASKFSRILATAGITAGKQAYYYMRYDDSPERLDIPIMFYTVIADRVDTILPEELEPVGSLFNAVVLADSALLVHETAQRASILDGARRNVTLVVNSGLPHDKIVYLVQKYQAVQDWYGKLVTIEASKYHQDLTYGLLGALLKGYTTVKLDHLIAALETLKIGEDAKLAVIKAYEDAVVSDVEVPANESLVKGRMGRKLELPKQGPWDMETYRTYQKAAADARSYIERLNAMPPWEVLAPGLVEFGPKIGENRNIGFKTSFARFRAPVIDYKKCIDCKLCSFYCPDGCIDYNEIKIDYDFCKGCAVCANVCPTKAITMITELEFLEGLKDPELEKMTLGAAREYGY